LDIGQDKKADCSHKPFMIKISKGPIIVSSKAASTMVSYNIAFSTGSSMIILWLACMLSAATTTVAQTTIQFSKPVRLGSQTSAVSVPNNFIFDEINAFEADLLQDIVAAAMAEVKGLTVTSFTTDFPTPTVLLSGSTQNTVTVTVSGLKRVTLKVRVSAGFVTTLFCFGSLRGEITIKDLAITATYNYFTGSVNGIQSTFSDVDADVGCSFPSLGFFLIELADLFLPFGKIAGNLITQGVADLNGRFENVFSLQDALAGAEETGLREIRQSAEDALMILGGVKSAVACFIANFITEEMIRRLGLQTASQIDQLRRLLSALPDFIAARLPDEAAFISGNIVGAALETFLTTNLPSVQSFLLAQLNTAFALSVDLVRDIEMVAIQALGNIVKTDFGRLIGGVNARLVINRSTNVVSFDGFHTGPASFLGIAEATIPCSPTYTIPPVDNAAEYLAFNSNQRIVYSSSLPTSDLMPDGLLTGAQVQGPWGLYSYVEYATIRLINFSDCGGCTEANFRWPQCPVGGEPVVPRPVPAPVVAAEPIFRMPTPRLPPGFQEP
jgi:hypothetical protein